MHPLSNDRPAEVFVSCLKESEALNGASAELIASMND
jgi:hypothetical protein